MDLAPRCGANGPVGSALKRSCAERRSAEESGGHCGGGGGLRGDKEMLHACHCGMRLAGLSASIASLRALPVCQERCAQRQ